MEEKQIKGHKVEQISRGKIVIDYDQKYSRSELKRLFAYSFMTNDDLEGCVGEIKYRIHAKNITYLGYPWEDYKKRIQLWADLKSIVQKDYDDEFVPLIIGVYHYNRTVVFVDFDVDSYLDGNTNNSAAHVQTFDLQRGLKQGIYSKIDKNGNRITVFNKENIQKYLEDKLCIYSQKQPVDYINDVLYDFYISIPSKWEGIESYKYLVEVNHPKKRETEWPGFYHEALFEKYLDEHKPYKKTVLFQQNKGKDELDFDLFYPQINCYGDLKCHTIGESAIPGNKIENLYEAIKSGPLYYVICEHTTVKDEGPEYKVLNYWNNNIREESKRGKDIEKQKGRMKASVYLVDYIIVQIDEFNYDKLDSFQKGFLNSNGKPRGEKFSIPEKLMDEFVIRKEHIVNRGNIPVDFPDDAKISETILNLVDMKNEGMNFNDCKNKIAECLNLSNESLMLPINDYSQESLFEFELNRVLIKLKQQGKISQTRKGGEKCYKIK